MTLNKKSLLISATALAAALAIGGVATSASAATTKNVDIYRLYNPNTGEHFYTESAAEKNADVSAGWNYEGIGWQAPSTSKTPIYRVYNPNAKGGDHYYTKSKFEASSLVSKGWRWDNGGKPVFYSGGSIPTYVAYNPNAQSGAHNYTVNKAEQNNLLNVGWKYGATAWYATGAGKAAPSTGVQSAPRAVDVNIVGAGGNAASNPGSFRNLYANKTFDSAPTGTPAISVSANIKMNGTSDGSELQFVLAGTKNPGGQIGVELHNNASGVNQMPYWKSGINVAAINFAQNAGTTGQQFYSTATSVPTIAQGQTVKAQIKYYNSGIMQTYINGTLIGQYNTKLSGQSSAPYVVHATATNASISVTGLTAQVNGKTVSPANGTSTSGVTGAGVLYK